MTMPFERTRALRWGLEVLQTISENSSVPRDEILRAQGLLEQYPTPEVVRRWIDTDRFDVSDSASQAIEAAGELFRRLYRRSDCPPDLRRELMFTLRHFPEPGEAERFFRSVIGFSVRDWLLPE